MEIPDSNFKRGRIYRRLFDVSQMKLPAPCLGDSIGLGRRISTETAGISKSQSTSDSRWSKVTGGIAGGPDSRHGNGKLVDRTAQR
ncbi:hypothetical protein EVAR_25591_1 [Eumeta japonica]|uniref:Uncharacterized protein n=1 Tax=Eumeta variegata TaxID=151549 RepID=A0A4C1V220_EUMVA|nr:hypothetical protein EVAR_25591_1 [Eumeta japonica]